MSEEKQDPQWKPNDMDFGVANEIVIKSAKPVATGESKYGTWNLWIVTVNNQPAYSDRKQKSPDLKNYSGDAICFPSAKLHEQFLEHTKGTQENVKIKVTLKAEKGKLGPITKYYTELVEAGTTPVSNVTHEDGKLLKDWAQYVEQNIVENNLETFKKLAMGDTYKIPETEVDKLWSIANEA